LFSARHSGCDHEPEGERGKYQLLLELLLFGAVFSIFLFFLFFFLKKNNVSLQVPITVRLAWHASGTYDKSDNSGGSDGAHMRFEPEFTDGANAGLSIVQDLLKPVKEEHPELSIADIWTMASCSAVKFAGGPEIPHRLGRVDDADGKRCPLNGRLPDASQGAEHLREVFGRMGFNDQEIVALSGAHTLGRCHVVRSGYDGPWTDHPLRFDNGYFKGLMGREWKKKEWDGPFQYVDVETESVMMLPTDMALRTDDKFRVFAELYAKDEQKFFDDFSAAYAKLISLGCPAQCNPASAPVQATKSEQEQAGLNFREQAMHGSVLMLKRFREKANVHETEAVSLRTALHKAAFWGHDDASKYLVEECKLDANAQDFSGDTALHDAARFGHAKVVDILIKGGASLSIKNKKGQTPYDVAVQYGYPALIKSNM
jgi:catalase (peroxidase I)